MRDVCVILANLDITGDIEAKQTSESTNECETESRD